MAAYNEEAYLAASVRSVTEGLRARPRRFEVLVVENGSTDDTAAIAGQLAATLPEVRSLSLRRADYGAALRAGFLASSGDVVVNFDVDHHDLDFLDEALAILDGSGADMIVGSKRAASAVDTRRRVRRLVTQAFSTVLRLGFSLGVSDTHGMKALRRASLLGLVEQCRFGADLFDTELVLRAERAGLAVAEIGVRVDERRPPRTSIAWRAVRTAVGLVRLRLLLGHLPQHPPARGG